MLISIFTIVGVAAGPRSREVRLIYLKDKAAKLKCLNSVGTSVGVPQGREPASDQGVTLVTLARVESQGKNRKKQLNERTAKIENQKPKTKKDVAFENTTLPNIPSSPHCQLGLETSDSARHLNLNSTEGHDP
jgi:hypothetical protein